MTMRIQPLDDQPIAPATDNIAIGVDGGEFHTCAVAEGGAALCWGNNQWGQATAPVSTTLVSQSGGIEGKGHSDTPSISADGRFVAFKSSAANLVEGDNNLNCGWSGNENCADIFVFDRQTGEIELVSVSTSGAQAALGASNPKLSADGRFVAFASSARNLVEGDTNEASDVFVHDRTSGQTLRVSLASDGAQANGGSGLDLAISGDGRFVAFSSGATNLVEGDTNGLVDIFAHDRQTGETRRVSVASDGVQSNNTTRGAAISADGRYVVFSSTSIHLVRPDTNVAEDIFLHDLLTGQTTLVSMAPDGSQANKGSFDPQISADGRFVAFHSNATNLMPDLSDPQDLYVLDRQTGKYFNLPGVYVDDFALSANGRFVAFISSSSRLAGVDTNGVDDAFVYDLQTGWITRVSVAYDGAQGNGPVKNYDSLAISADGLSVAFASEATNMVPGGTLGYRHIFVNQRSLSSPLRLFLSLVMRK